MPEGTIGWDAGGVRVETWYRIAGDLDADGAPLLVLHGGPGATHDYLANLADLATDERAVVFYDQVGNGRSTHLPDRGPEFWTVELFLRELQHVLRALGLVGRHHVLGQSWGGFLAQEYSLTRPSGLLSLVLADTAASMAGFVAAAERLRAGLPPEVEATLRRHETAGTTGDPAYAAACDVYYRRHVCRLDPWPADLVEAFRWLERDPTVYRTMNGPSEFHVTGSLAGWSVVERLGEIAVPTLIISGRYDEATPALQDELQRGIPCSEWVMFERSAHVPHVEEHDRYVAVVSDWLKRHDRLDQSDSEDSPDCLT